MSQPYFVRHTPKILVRKSDLQRLWEEDRVAIHFPGDTSGNERDSKSLNPEDYKESYDKGAIRAFAELGREGGYVWAQSYVAPRQVKIGYVVGCEEGGEGVKMDHNARWELRGNHYEGRRDGDPATLKTLRMEKKKIVERGEAMSLRAAIPRNWPVCRWKVGDRLRALAKNEAPKPDWSNLSDAEQEAACAEFLRERHEDRLDLPVLSRLLLPVGRTLKDIDIYGVDTNGSLVYAQVTYHRIGDAPAKQKASRLAEYAPRNPNAKLVFFGTGSIPATNELSDRILYVSGNEEVLPWLKNDALYEKALFIGGNGRVRAARGKVLAAVCDEL